MFARKSPNGAWWVPILEKASAKFFGTYSVMAGGNMNQGWMQLTGMPSRSYKTTNTADLVEILKLADEAGHVINASVSESGCVGGKKNNLPCGHAYTLLSHVNWKDGKDYFRIRNPWGNTEWKGDFDDNDTSSLAKEFFADNGQPVVNDGTFWMGLDDFKANFYQVSVGDYLEGWKHSSAPQVFNRETEKTSKLSMSFTNPVEQAVSIGLVGNQDRNFMDDYCEHEDRLGYGFRPPQNDQIFY